MQLPDIEVFTQLTRLIADHGVYAFSVIFIFYLQRRSVKLLLGASSLKDRAYFKKIYTSVVVGTYVLVLLCTAAWAYTNFWRVQRHVATGVVGGLTSPQGSEEPRPGGPARTYHSIAPELAADLDFYPTPEVPSASDGKYGFKWALLSPEPLGKIAFTFQQRTEGFERETSTQDPFADPTDDWKLKDRKPIEMRFVLDLSDEAYSPTTTIHLNYQLDPNPLSIGTLWLSPRDGSSGRVHVPWSEPPDPAAGGGGLVRRMLDLFPFSSIALNAHAEAQTVFDEDGSYNAKTERILKAQLSNPNLRTQMAARTILIQHGAKSFRFIEGSLDTIVSAPSDEYDMALLVHNLNEAIRRIEASGHPFSPEGYLKLALAYYSIGQYAEAADGFDRAGSEIGKDNPVNLFQRGYAYNTSQRYVEAIQSFEMFLERTTNAFAKSSTLDLIGTAHYLLGDLANSATYHQRALEANANNMFAKNNLAYTYVMQGDNLDEAMRLVDEALAGDSENPSWLDTKAWILYKQGKYDDALPLLQKALIGAPDDELMKEHLREVEKALNSRSPVGVVK